MKFDCGETDDELEERIGNWHTFFTLLPRGVGSHDCRWLEVIERRGERYKNKHGYILWRWKYRAYKR